MLNPTNVQILVMLRYSFIFLLKKKHFIVENFKYTPNERDQYYIILPCIHH